MATEFGTKLQRIRQQAGMTLYEVAQIMKLSTAFLSAVENGRKRVPDDFVNKLVQTLPGARAVADELETLANHARKQVVLPLAQASRQDADLATALARKFSSLSEAQKRQMREILTVHNEETERA